MQSGSYDHISVAHDIVNEYKYTSNLLEPIPDDALLLNHGWVHISISNIPVKQYCIYWNYRRKLTHEQRCFLEPYFQDVSYVSPIALMNWEWDTDHQ